MRYCLALFVWLMTYGAALAQQGCGPSNPNCIVPTAPVGTSNNQAASTAFVQQNVAGFLPTTQPNQVLGNNGTTAAPAFAINARTQLPNAKFYINSSPSATATCGPAGASTCAAGNDSNNCLSPAQACLTLANVVALVLGTYDFADTRVDVYLAHTSGVSGATPTNYSASCSGPVIGSAAIFAHGDSNAGASVTVIQAPNSGTAIVAINLCTISFDYVTFNDSPSTNANSLISVGGTHATSHVDLANVTFGALASGVALVASESGTVSLLGGTSITGNEVQALQATKGGIIDFTGTTMAISNNLTFTTFAVIWYPGTIAGVSASTFGSPSGVTGTKCQSLGVSAIIGNPTDPNQIFPGNTNCVQGEYTGAVGVQQSGGGYNFGSAGQPLLSGGGAGAFDTFGTLGYGGGGTNATSLAAAQANFEITTIGVAVTGINFNSIADTAFAFTMPSGFTRIQLDRIEISNASHTLTTATFGVFTATAAGGVALIASGTAITVASTSDQGVNNMQSQNGLTTTSAIAASLATPNTIYFRVTNGEGAAATADVTAVLRVLP